MAEKLPLKHKTSLIDIFTTLISKSLTIIKSLSEIDYYFMYIISILQNFGVPTYANNQLKFNTMKTPKNNGKPWTQNEVTELKKLSTGNTPTGLIANKLGRTPDSIRSKATKENISLKPTNQSPYDRNVANAKKVKKEK